MCAYGLQVRWFVWKSLSMLWTYGFGTTRAPRFIDPSMNILVFSWPTRSVSYSRHRKPWSTDYCVVLISHRCECAPMACEYVFNQIFFAYHRIASHHEPYLHLTNKFYSADRYKSHGLCRLHCEMNQVNMPGEKILFNFAFCYTSGCTFARCAVQYFPAN